MFAPRDAYSMPHASRRCERRFSKASEIWRELSAYKANSTSSYPIPTALGLLTKLLTNCEAAGHTGAYSKALDSTRERLKSLVSLLDPVEARGSRPLAPTIDIDPYDIAT